MCIADRIIDGKGIETPFGSFEGADDPRLRIRSVRKFTRPKCGDFGTAVASTGAFRVRIVRIFRQVVRSTLHGHSQIELPRSAQRHSNERRVSTGNSPE